MQRYDGQFRWQQGRRREWDDGYGYPFQRGYDVRGGFVRPGVPPRGFGLGYDRPYRHGVPAWPGMKRTRGGYGRR